MMRAELHELVDRLPDEDVARARFYLTLFNAPIDDEPTADDDRAAIEEAARSGVSERTRWSDHYFR